MSRRVGEDSFQLLLLKVLTARDPAQTEENLFKGQLYDSRKQNENGVPARSS